MYLDKTRKSENQTLLKLERSLINNQITQFRYESGVPYIVLCQEKVQSIMQLSYNENPALSHNCLILDRDLGVIQRRNKKRDFEKQLQEKEENNFQIPYLSFLNLQYQLPKFHLSPITYRKFPELNNFLFGRSGFGREHQSFKVQSDTISKQHCYLKHFKDNSSSEVKRLRTLKKILTKKTCVSSLCRKITNQLWENILKYISVEQKYFLFDLSRNGTWITRLQQKKIELKQNFQFEIEGQNYSIFISRIFSIWNTVGQTIISHNQRVSKHIDEFKKQVIWCYYQPAKKSILLSPGEQLNKIAVKDDEKISVIVLKIKYKDYHHDFYFLGASQKNGKPFRVGVKQDIDVGNQDDQFATIQGKVSLQGGRWYFDTLSHNTRGTKNIWTKIPKQIPFRIDPKFSYKLRLAYHTTFDLDFVNF